MGIPPQSRRHRFLPRRSQARPVGGLDQRGGLLLERLDPARREWQGLRRRHGGDLAAAGLLDRLRDQLVPHCAEAQARRLAHRRGHPHGVPRTRCISALATRAGLARLSGDPGFLVGVRRFTVPSRRQDLRRNRRLRLSKCGAGRRWRGAALHPRRRFLGGRRDRSDSRLGDGARLPAAAGGGTRAARRSR